MGVLETALHWLRPLVETKTWDYCVVWKLGDDPSSYIEWVGCCCGGVHGDSNNSLKVKEEDKLLIPLCRDTHIKHLAKSKACGALSHLPSSIPLYSGIHGEAVVSTEPRWISCTKDSNPNQSDESTGTQVLIPVAGGLIELFSSKQISKDEKIIDFVIAQYNITMEQEAITAHSYPSISLNVQPHDPLPDKYLINNWPAPFEAINFFPKLPFLPPLAQLNHHPSFEGSSTGSNPSNEHSSFNSGSVHVSPNVSVNGTFDKNPADDKKSINNRTMSSKQEVGLLSGAANHLVEKDKLKSRQRIEREQYQSKNLITERNRRNRIKDGLFTLRSLVPKITKMDRAAILGDAIEYIQELQKKVKELKDELREMDEEEEANKKKYDLEIPNLSANKGSTPTRHNQDPSSADEMEKMEVQVEVYQIGTRDFLLKLLYKQKQGGFMRLMEAMDSLGLQLVDANITTYGGKVLNILKVEVNQMEVSQPKRLKDSLIKLMCKTLQQ